MLKRITAPWPTVGLLWVAFLINYIDRQAVFSIYPALQNDLHFSNAQLGLIGTAFLWVYSLSMLFTGRLADVVRRDRIIILAIVLWSLATLTTALSPSATVFVISRAFVGVTEALYMPAALGFIASLHSFATRSRAIAAHGSAQYIGIFAGGSYGGWMADHIGWRQGFIVLTVVGLLYALLLWRLLGEAKPSSPEPPRGVARPAHSNPMAVFASPCYVTICLAFFAFCCMLWMLYAWLPSFIYERYHLSMSQSGVVATLYLQTSSAAGVLLGGTLADLTLRRTRAARYYVAGTGLLLCTPFAYHMLAGDSLFGLKISATLFGLTAGFFMGNHFAASYDVTAEDNYGFGAGTLNMIGGLAGGAGILAAGLWKATLGIETLMFWAAICTAVLACALLIMAGLFFKRDWVRPPAISITVETGELS